MESSLIDDVPVGDCDLPLDPDRQKLWDDLDRRLSDIVLPSSPLPLCDMNSACKDMDPILFRGECLKRLCAALIGAKKPNALLVGAAGVGKTAVVEELARRLALDDPRIPRMLRGHTVYELSLASLSAGANLVGDLEERLLDVVDFAEDESNGAILFIDEFHQLVSNSESSSTGYGKVAQILKPALARGRLQVIGATTLQESRTIDNDPALSRRFTRVIVDELDREQTVEILRSMVPSLVKHYDNDVSISPEVLPCVVDIADRYLSASSHRPDTAVTLLDRTCADLVVGKSSLLADPDLPDVVKKGLVDTVQPVHADTLKESARAIAQGHARPRMVARRDMEKAVSPVKGQERALGCVLDLLERDQLDLFPRTRPLALLLAGPSGVGKTETSRLLSRALTGEDPIVLNMTEFAAASSLSRIVGSPRGYIGSDSNAEMPFDVLAANPYRLVVLDEFEKCNKGVQRLFMRAFDEGVVQDAKGKTIDFTKSIVFCTTNAGAGELSRAPLGFATAPETHSRASVVSTLSSSFDVELLNRFTAIILFDPIGEEVYLAVLKDIYAREMARLHGSHSLPGMPDELSEEAARRLLAETYVPALGARPARKAVESYIEACAIDDIRASLESGDQSSSDDRDDRFSKALGMLGPFK